MMVEKIKIPVRFVPLVVAGMIQMNKSLLPLSEADIYPAALKPDTTILVFDAQ
jgi:hypothetical protein